MFLDYLKAATNLYDNCQYDPMTDELLINGEKPTQDQFNSIQIEANRLLEMDIREGLSKRLNRLIGSKRKELKNTLAGYEVNEEQEKAYEAKYKLALDFINNNDATAEELLQIEADVAGISVTDLANLIIAARNSWVTAINSYNQKTEILRLMLNKLIESGSFEMADIVLLKAKNLTPETTKDEILAWFTE